MKLIRITGALLLITTFAGPALAAEKSPAAASAKADSAQAGPKLGKITPNGPYRIWTAINGVLPDYAALKGGAGLRAQVQGLTAEPAFGKKPGDVLRQGMEFHHLLEALRGELKLGKIQVYKDPLARAVTPAVVFVNAGFGLDGLVEAFHVAMNKPDASLGKYFDVPVPSGKSPSDVYALVELATRRLRLIQGS